MSVKTLLKALNVCDGKMKGIKIAKETCYDFLSKFVAHKQVIGLLKLLDHDIEYERSIYDTLSDQLEIQKVREKEEREHDHFVTVRCHIEKEKLDKKFIYFSVSLKDGYLFGLIIGYVKSGYITVDQFSELTKEYVSIYF